ncbi:MAG: D-alanyl-D-alanine carboxypeptidase [Oscillospiraceae bacterium]|nr:D-alanyl-D-alanine carboxypeptidase [Oscillospiraceae bacterium]
MMAAVSAVICIHTAAAALDLSARSAVLMDAESGRVLYAQRAGERAPMASITKLMTALTAVDLCPLEQTMTVTPEQAATPGSSMYLRPGETLTLEQLLYGLLLASGNDAALTVAEGCCGDTETFVAAMNDRAAQLGLTGTHFANPHGLDAEGHYATAEDIAGLMCAALERDVLARILSTSDIVMPGRTLTNHNKLLWQYDGCIAGKTGYTDNAGRTLVTAAERDGQVLVAVTFQDRNDWADHAALFDYGFSSYPRRTLCTAGEILADCPVAGGTEPTGQLLAAETCRYPLAEEEKAVLTLETPESASAPVKAGEPAGRAVYTLDGQEIASTELVWAQDIPAAQRWSGFWGRFTA